MSRGRFNLSHDKEMTGPEHNNNTTSGSPQRILVLNVLVWILAGVVTGTHLCAHLVTPIG